MKKWIAAAIAAMMLFSFAFADEAELTVRGSGVVMMTADRACIVLGVRESSADVMEAQGTVNAKINAIFEALLAAGIEQKDISTESLYLYADYDYSEAQERIIGYTATNTLSIQTSDLDRLGEYIDIAFGAGANTLENVQFMAQNGEEARKEALKLAVKNAMEKAEVIAAAAGLEIGSVVSISEEWDNYGAEAGAKFSNMRAAGVEEAADTTLVQASSLSISASVTVEFELNEGKD